MSESDLNRTILLDHSRGPTRLFRNNVGECWHGPTIETLRGPATLHRHHLKYGLAVGSSDFVGFKTVTVTPEMVGRQLAVFVGVESKTARGRVSDEQAVFLDFLRSMHAFHGSARSTQDVAKILTLTGDYP